MADEMAAQTGATTAVRWAAVSASRWVEHWAALMVACWAASTDISTADWTADDSDTSAAAHWAACLAPMKDWREAARKVAQMAGWWVESVVEWKAVHWAA